ncbi:small, acid-soluble spore protein, H family [Bacillus sp. D-CC]
MDVTYEGVPVWIESCDEQSGVAQVNEDFFYSSWSLRSYYRTNDGYILS